MMHDVLGHAELEIRFTITCCQLTAQDVVDRLDLVLTNHSYLRMTVRLSLQLSMS